MKILVFCLLSTLGLSFAVPTLDSNNINKYMYLSSQLQDKQNEDELNVLLQAMASTEDDQGSDDDDIVAELQAMASTKDDQDSDDDDAIVAELQTNASTEDDQDSADDDGTVAELQGVFNVLAQVEVEKAREKADTNMAISQLWKSLSRSLWRVGKRYLRRKLCNQKQGVSTLLQELVGEQGIQQVEVGDNKAHAELQTLFNALNMIEAKVMQDDTPDGNAKAENWWNRVRHYARRKVRRLTRKYLC